MGKFDKSKEEPPLLKEFWLRNVSRTWTAHLKFRDEEICSQCDVYMQTCAVLTLPLHVYMHTCAVLTLPLHVYMQTCAVLTLPLQILVLTCELGFLGAINVIKNFILGFNKIVLF